MVRQFPAQQERVETGPIQFGDDWPGIFIRGDNALNLAMCLDMALNHGDNGIYAMAAKSFIETLRSCDERAIQSGQHREIEGE